MMFSQEKSQAAFDHFLELGGHCVWESDMVVVALDDTDVTDDDLLHFNDFDSVEILSLSNTQITDAGLAYLEQLTKLESLTMINTRVTESRVAKLREALPNTTITTEPMSKDKINPFTGEPFSE